MFKIKSDRALWIMAASLAVLIPVFIQALFGMYLEDNEAIVAGFVYGVLGQMGWEQLWSDFQTFSLPVLYHIGTWFQWLPVYGWWKMMFVVVALSAVLYYCFKELAWHGVKSKTALFTVTVLVIGLLADSVFFQHCIRHSIILSFAALLLNKQNLEQQGKVSIPGIFIFLLAVIARMHAAMIMLALFMLYHLLTGTALVKIIKSHAVMVVLGTVFVISYQLNGIYTSDMGRYIEANYEYALIEKASVYPLPAQATAKDSAVYTALQQFFISDSAQFTRAYFEKTVNLNYEEKFLFNQRNIQVAYNDLSSKFSGQLYNLLLLPLILFMLFYGAGWQIRTRHTAVFAALWLLVLLLLLLILVDEIKIRFFSPYLAMGLLTLFMISYPAWLKKNGLAKYIAAIAALVFLGLKGTELGQMAHVEQQKEADIQLSAKLFGAYCRQYPILTFVESEIPFQRNPFYRSPATLYQKLASFDGGYMIYYHYFKDKFERVLQCSPLNFPALINLFERNRELKFYATPERLRLMELYFQAVYQTRLTFEPVQPQPDFKLNGLIYTVRVERLPSGAAPE